MEIFEGIQGAHFADAEEVRFYLLKGSDQGVDGGLGFCGMPWRGFDLVVLDIECGEGDRFLGSAVRLKKGKKESGESAYLFQCERSHIGWRVRAENEKPRSRRGFAAKTLRKVKRSVWVPNR